MPGSIRIQPVACGLEFKVRWINMVVFSPLLPHYTHIHRPILVQEWSINPLGFSQKCGFGKKVGLIDGENIQGVGNRVIDVI